MAMSRHTIANSYYSLVPEWQENIQDYCGIEKSRIVQLRRLEESMADLTSKCNLLHVAHLTAMDMEKEQLQKELKETADRLKSIERGFLDKQQQNDDADRMFYSQANNRSKFFSLPLHVSGLVSGVLVGSTCKFTCSTQWSFEAPTFEPATVPNRIVYHEDLLIPVEMTFACPHFKIRNDWTVNTLFKETRYGRETGSKTNIPGVVSLQIRSSEIIGSVVNIAGVIEVSEIYPAQSSWSDDGSESWVVPDWNIRMEHEFTLHIALGK
jgi:hypothetical protein